MKILFLLVALGYIAFFAIILACKIINPAANSNVQIPWDFPVFSMLLFAAFEIISNQENILYHLKNK